MRARNKAVSIQMGENDEFEIRCTVTPAIRQRLGGYDGPTPAEPSEIEDLCVWIQFLGSRIDIADKLTLAQRDAIHEKVFTFLETL